MVHPSPVKSCDLLSLLLMKQKFVITHQYTIVQKTDET